MRSIIIITLFLFISCGKEEEGKYEKIEVAVKTEENIKNPTFSNNKYNTRENYLDSLGKHIIPNNKYQYWQYATYNSSFSKSKYTILKQGGNLSLREKINEKINPPYIVGIFQGGHPNFRCNYISTVKDGKVNYIKTEEEFRDFLGTIDNLEEALLLARTYGYRIGSDATQSEYIRLKNGFILHLIKYNEFPVRIESVEVTISIDGFIKTKSLGIYCEGENCYK